MEQTRRPTNEAGLKAVTEKLILLVSNPECPHLWLNCGLGGLYRGMIQNFFPGLLIL